MQRKNKSGTVISNVVDGWKKRQKEKGDMEREIRKVEEKAYVAEKKRQAEILGQIKAQIETAKEVEKLKVEKGVEHLEFNLGIPRGYSRNDVDFFQLGEKRRRRRRD